MPGPPPKRSEQRRRKNAPVRPILPVSGAAPKAPPLGVEVHELASDWYESLAGSPESRFFTPAVWQRARIAALMLSRLILSSKPSSMWYAAIQSDWRSLLVDPAEQRRLQIEVQEAVEDPDAAHAAATVTDLTARLGG